MSTVPNIDDTIAALASAPGPAERGIVRVSGPQTKEVLTSIFIPDDRSGWEGVHIPWRHSGTVPLTGLHLPLPVSVLLWPTNRSYTRQPTAELHTVGSPPVLEALLQQLFANGARPAQRGEFSLRAFLAGRIDLVQAEAVLGVIEADNQQQLRLALEQLGGGLSHRIAALHEELLLHLSDLEAGLDFAEEDIEFVTRDELTRRMSEGREFLQSLLTQAASRLQSTGRYKVVLAGLTNAGKSTLFNVLAGGDAALVSPAPGTTRDYLSVPVMWNGVAIELIDTAGWDDLPADVAFRRIDRAADELRDDQWRRADLILWCTPADLSTAAAALDARLRDSVTHPGKPLLPLTTKADLCPNSTAASELRVSATDRTGIEALKAAITTKSSALPRSEHILGTTVARCQESLRGAAEAMDRAREATADCQGDELIAVELRGALDHLGQIVGLVYTDDILDRIFSRFCIGK